MRPTTFSLFLLLVSLLSGSCASPTEPGPVDPAPDTTAFEDKSWTSFYFTRSVVRYDGDVSITDAVAGRYYGNPIESASSGTSSIWLNGIMVPRTDHYLYGWWMRGGESLPLVFDGSYHRVRIVGTGSAPWVYDSLRSPPSPARITLPQTGDTLSLSRGFRVEWRKMGLLDSQSINGQISIRGWGSGLSAGRHPDSSSMYFDGARLTEVMLSPGRIDIDLTWRTQRSARTPTGHRYFLTIETTDRIQATLVE